MSEEIIVSVLMPCYNHEKYLKKAIESIIDQKTDFKYEIIIHDDASTDKSAEIIKKYEEQYPELIKCIYQKDNKYQKGIDIVRNYMLPLAKGKYIAACECDDYWVSNEKLQKQVDVLERDSKIIACSHNCVIIDDDDNVTGKSYTVYHYLKTHIFNLWRYECGLFPGQTAAVMYRASAMKFRSKEHEDDYYAIRCQGDQKLDLHLLLNGDIYYSEEIMSAHRVVRDKGDSWTARISKKDMALYMFKASRDLRAYAKKHYGIVLHNHYVTFHRGLHIIIGKVTKKSAMANDDFKEMSKECGSAIIAVLYVFGMGIRCIPITIAEKMQRNKFDLT